MIVNYFTAKSRIRMLILKNILFNVFFLVNKTRLSVEKEFFNGGEVEKKYILQI